SGRAPTPVVAGEVWRQVEALVDGELSRLPDKYRAPIVLCDLQGRTVQEAAATRLARGRARLAERLCKHGLAIPAVTAALAQASADGAPPLAEAMVRRVATGGAVSADVA